MHAARHTPVRRLPAYAFPLAAAAIYAVALAMVRLVPEAARPGPVAYGLLADLLLTIPALWYVLVVRGRGAPARSLFPVLALSFAAASVVLPPAVRPGAIGLEVVIAAIELAALTVLGVAAVRAWRRARAGAGDLAGPEVLPERLAAVARRAFGVDRVADLLAFEVATIAYALAGWRLKPPADARAFTSHRDSGWSAALVGLVFVLLVETFPVHVLTERASPTLAWLLTAASAYSLLWLLGDFQALRHRPIRVTDDALLVRLGLRWSARVPWASIREVREPRAGDGAARGRDTLRAALIGDATVVIELSEPVVATGPYGIRRRCSRIALAPDDRRAFLAAVAERRSRTPAEPRPGPAAEPA